MLTNQSFAACKQDFHRLYQKHHRLYILRLASHRCGRTTGGCSGRARGFCQAAFADCLPLTRGRLGCGVPESDAASIDDPELLVLGETTSATHARDTPLFFNLDARRRGGAPTSPAARILGIPRTMLTMLCRQTAGKQRRLWTDRNQMARQSKQLGNHGSKQVGRRARHHNSP